MAPKKKSRSSRWENPWVSEWYGFKATSLQPIFGSQDVPNSPSQSPRSLSSSGACSRLGIARSQISERQPPGKWRSTRWSSGFNEGGVQCLWNISHVKSSRVDSYHHDRWWLSRRSRGQPQSPRTPSHLGITATHRTVWRELQLSRRGSLVLSGSSFVPSISRIHQWIGVLCGVVILLGPWSYPIPLSGRPGVIPSATVRFPLGLFLSGFQFSY